MHHCDKCGNDYQSQYYFAVQGICNVCFQKMSPQEQQAILEEKAKTNPIRATLDYSKRVGFGFRFLALLIDFVIVYILGSFLPKFFFDMEHIESSIADLTKSGMMTGDDFIQMLTLITPVYILMFTVNIIYYITEILFSGTPGKLILGIRIVDDNAKKSSKNKLFNRFILKNGSSLIFLIIFVFISILVSNGSGLSSVLAIPLIIGLIWGLIVTIGCFYVLGEKRQAFHDIIAKTAVYRKSDIIEEDKI